LAGSLTPTVKSESALAKYKRACVVLRGVTPAGGSLVVFRHAGGQTHFVITGGLVFSFPSHPASLALRPVRAVPANSFPFFDRVAAFSRAIKPTNQFAVVVKPICRSVCTRPAKVNT
jgi:hypothetical protein